MTVNCVVCPDCKNMAAAAYEGYLGNYRLTQVNVVIVIKLVTNMEVM